MKKKSELDVLVKEQILYPKEQLMKVRKQLPQLCIGIPKEIDGIENRVCLTPEAVALIVNNGHVVQVETGAGLNAKFSDREYSEAGAKIVYSKQEVFDSEIVLKVDPPTMEEIGYMKPGKTLISALQMSTLDAAYIAEINKKRITGLAYEFIEDKAGGKPVVKSMSEIAGSAVMLIAAEYLISKNGMGVILGGVTGVPSTKVLILGAGTVAEYAARTAIGLGAEVKVFDSHLYRLRRLKLNLGLQLYTSVIDTVNLRKELREADVVIGSLRAEEGTSCLVTDEMVAEMKPNSIIVDVSIDQGGCFETSEITNHMSPIFRKYDVIHYCVPNIPSRVARTATVSLSNIFAPILLQIAEAGGVEEMIHHKEWFMNGIYSYKGYLTNSIMAKKYTVSYKDIKLLTASMF
ncbi:alanine dehydrogenase [Cytophaga aurantiaca]|uniref:alanine dehydrogenase n=1 Tax=Cytophaga aurantiaca TaxID=29530 RepID=UPI00036B0C1B|nr:alanine dehydrogenase [Cytophaga aurantiaca]